MAGARAALSNRGEYMARMLLPKAGGARDRGHNLPLVSRYPIFEVEPWYPTELTSVPCDDAKTARERDGAYKQVIRTDWGARFLQIGAELSGHLRG